MRSITRNCHSKFRFMAVKMKFLSIILCSICLTIIVNADSFEENKDLIVELSHGKLKGKSHDLYYSYESIPYAEPPIGELRFEAPKPYQQKWLEIFDATRKPKVCMQWTVFAAGDDKLIGEEDCLVVNIYKPKTGKQKYPVLIYIHGGAFMFGAANDLSEQLLMESGNVILVSMSYRLGPLGFLSTEDASIAGNFGLKDQQLALNWIKKNIAHFGGDPEKMLLMGFSAGSASTHLQMLQPSLKNIVNAVVSFSGVALNPWSILKNSRKSCTKLAELLQCPNIENTQVMKICLQNKKAEDIVRSVKEFLNYGYNPFTTFGPVVESEDVKDAFMKQHPRDIIKTGNYSHLPWLASYAAQDACYNAVELLEIDPKTGKQIINEVNENWLEIAPKNLFLNNIKDNPQEYAKQLKEQYLGNLTFSEENYMQILEMYMDVIFKNGIHESLKLHSKHTDAPIYGYVYDNPTEYKAGDEKKNGTCHGKDFTMIMKNPYRTLKSDQQIISQKFIKMLEHFVETGELAYGDCKFVNNAGNSEKLEILHITKDKC